VSESPTRLVVVLGTRPEAIKLAPVILEARQNPWRFDTRVVATGQHREMLDQVLGLFDIQVDRDLDIMRRDQDLCEVTTEALRGLARVLRELVPDCVVVQGDTTTALAGALAAFYQKVPVAHVEAGLRTYDRHHPFPEEVNRRLISQVADYHFAPTEAARANLLAEGIGPERIWVTGNTGIDALLLTLARHRESNGHKKPHAGPTLLLTAHRRENHGRPLERICRAVLTLLGLFPELRVICPVHLSPRVRRTIVPLLGSHPRVALTGPLDYREFVLAMAQADVILTDSGGIQEEAPSLGKAVLVLRETTERPEGVAAGTARLVGTDERVIVEEAAALLRDPARRQPGSRLPNPFGDGRATERILAVLERATQRAPIASQAEAA
jgi:UDP-N-acetylglucosamine 2-epimerase (non-hydrolysing)